MFIQAFVAQASVERFDIGILIRFSGLNLPQLHATLMRPAEHGATAEFFTVVRADYAGQAAIKPQPIQNSSQLFATDCPVRNDGTLATLPQQCGGVERLH